MFYSINADLNRQYFGFSPPNLKWGVSSEYGEYNSILLII